jgi:hypothetical protein
MYRFLLIKIVFYEFDILCIYLDFIEICRIISEIKHADDQVRRPDYALFYIQYRN